MPDRVQFQIKPPKTIEEQLGILKGRNLIVEDDDFALDALRRISYYRFRGRFYVFKQKKTPVSRGFFSRIMLAKMLRKHFKYYSHYT